jgi:hypothetical protein
MSLTLGDYTRAVADATKAEECVAVALENKGRASLSADKMLDERGLADARLTADKGDAALPGACRRKGSGKPRQLALAFKQLQCRDRAKWSSSLVRIRRSPR